MSGSAVDVPLWAWLVLAAVVVISLAVDLLGHRGERGRGRAPLRLACGRLSDGSLPRLHRDQDRTGTAGVGAAGGQGARVSTPARPVYAPAPRASLLHAGERAARPHTAHARAHRHRG